MYIACQHDIVIYCYVLGAFKTFAVIVIQVCFFIKLMDIVRQYCTYILNIPIKTVQFTSVGEGDIVRQYCTYILNIPIKTVQFMLARETSFVNIAQIT